MPSVDTAWPWPREPPRSSQAWFSEDYRVEIHCSFFHVECLTLQREEVMSLVTRSPFYKHCPSLGTAWGTGMMALCFSLCEQKAKRLIVCPAMKRALRGGHTGGRGILKANSTSATWGLEAPTCCPAWHPSSLPTNRTSRSPSKRRAIRCLTTAPGPLFKTSPFLPPWPQHPAAVGQTGRPGPVSSRKHRISPRPASRAVKPLTLPGGYWGFLALFCCLFVFYFFLSDTYFRQI